MVKSVKVVSIVRLFQAQKIPMYRIALMQLTNNNKKVFFIFNFKGLTSLNLSGTY